jgi:hypothetical protein
MRFLINFILVAVIPIAFLIAFLLGISLGNLIYQQNQYLFPKTLTEGTSK